MDVRIHSDLAPLSTLPHTPFHMGSRRCELISAARTGYSGEDGFEIVAPSPLINTVWPECLAAGKEQGIKPCGRSARDMVSLVSCYPLSGHERSESSTPLQRGGRMSRTIPTEFAERPATRRLIDGPAPPP